MLWLLLIRVVHIYAGELTSCTFVFIILFENTHIIIIVLPGRKGFSVIASGEVP